MSVVAKCKTVKFAGEIYSAQKALREKRGGNARALIERRADGAALALTPRADASETYD